jgi:hypothetical protein
MQPLIQKKIKYLERSFVDKPGVTFLAFFLKKAYGKNSRLGRKSWHLYVYVGTAQNQESV